MQIIYYTRNMLLVLITFILHSYPDGGAKLHSYHSTNTVIEPCISSKQFRVKEIMRYIDKNIENPMCLDEIASNFYISPTYMCRIFKSATGFTIHQYIAKQRIIHATQLLAAGYSAAETCARCGFNEYSNFYKSFIGFIGVSPSQYLKKMRV